MSLLHRALVDITVEDLQRLVDNGVSEARHLDYKQELPDLKSQDEKREFLYDVSAMANGGGGEIVFGVEEDRTDGKASGRPLRVTGVHVVNPDSTVLSLENLIRDGIAPRIIGLQMRPIKLGEDSYALVIRVPRSLTAPHMVTINGLQRFYTRNSAGKHPMDVSELRAGFLASAGFMEQVRRWRSERLALLKANEGCAPIKPGAKIVLHLVPLASVDPQTLISVERLKEEASELRPLSSGGDRCINFDGFMMRASASRGEDPFAYTEFFRTGQIESVDTDILGGNKQERYIPSTYFEEQLIRGTRHYLKALRNVGAQPPIVIALALLDVKDYYLASNDHWNKWRIVQDDLVVPPTLIEDWTVGVDQVLRPQIDSIWNACGYSYSPNFDEQGNWKRR